MLRIGSTVWVFDSNRRVYPKLKPGEEYCGSGPIYREHWAPAKIVGETKRSWILDSARRGRKIPKAQTLHEYDICRSAVELDHRVWLNDHRYKLAEAVRDCNNITAMRAICDVLGYSPKP